MKSLVSIFVTLLGLTVVALAQPAGPQQSMPTGKAFLSKVAKINLTEIELGKLAEQKGNNQAVQDFGKRMVADHSKAQVKLEQVAKQEGVALPKHAGTEAAGLEKQLSSQSGERFDEMYMGHMLEGHKQAVAMIENEIEHGRNSTIKTYAESCLPVIQDHVRIAEDVAGKMGMAGKSGLDDPYKAITVAGVPK